MESFPQACNALSRPFLITTCGIIAGMALAACKTTQNTTTPPPIEERLAIIPDERTVIHYTLNNILSALEVEMTTNPQLINLISIKIYILEKLQEAGIRDVDIKIQLASPEIPNPDGSIPLFNVGIGRVNKTDGVATSAHMSTRDMKQNQLYRQQIIENFTSYLVGPLEELVNFIVKNNIEKEQVSLMMELFLKKHERDFREHGLSPTDSEVRIDRKNHKGEDNETGVIIQATDNSTGKQVLLIVPLDVDVPIRVPSHLTV